MNKNWLILPQIDREFIKKFPEYSRVVLQLLYNRGLKEKEEIEAFLNPDCAENGYDPFLFQNMRAAVELIIEHIKKAHFIVVYGDFDADGVTASAILAETLSTLKADVDVYIPDRASEGYGLNNQAIDLLAQAGAKLIITVDNGIRGKDEVEYAKSLGIDVIITDHHQPSEDESELPDCLIINPMAKGEKYPFKYLAGVGVAFKLAKALIGEAKLEESVKRKLEENILDLAAIGTVADCVTVLGENRIIIKEGLKIINKQNRVGLDELIKQAQINGRIDAWNIGWQIAPRLNAAGRLEHANTAFELLTTKNKQEAQAIAARLNDKNIERQKITNEIAEYCRQVVEKELGDDKILILADPAIISGANSWPEGVIGLVAGRLCEQYNRPVLVITQGHGEIKGSGRSIEEFNIIKALEEVKEFFLRFGGHAQACGFTLKSKDNLPDFVGKMKRIADTILKDIDLRPRVVVEAELDLEEVSEELIKDTEKFAPFGEDNERPRFASRNVAIRDIMTMGIDGRHVKFRMGNFWAVAFNQAETWQDLRIGDKIDIVYYVEMNEFNGRREAQLKVVDIKHNANTTN
ncbi:single-stranded-DNA-specific exonuclease RecJ [Patescibacteria group bacterium]|nr:single-stranded-DNA-specific exonuclease RecJ [Patescibacteria group bacterium]